MKVLDLSWKNCRRMWDWVAENYRDGMDVERMKHEWMKKNGFTKQRPHDCFFCEYEENHYQHGINTPYQRCTLCPGYLVDTGFSCTTFEYHYRDNPIAFYQYLLKLDAKRLGK